MCAEHWSIGPLSCAPTLTQCTHICMHQPRHARTYTHTDGFTCVRTLGRAHAHTDTETVGDRAGGPGCFAAWIHTSGFPSLQYCYLNVGERSASINGIFNTAEAILLQFPTLLSFTHGSWAHLEGHMNTKYHRRPQCNTFPSFLHILAL